MYGWFKEVWQLGVVNLAAYIYVKLILEGTTGTAYFDTIQVEQSDLGNAHNHIENGDFSYGLLG